MTWRDEELLRQAEASQRPWVEYPYPLRDGDVLCKVILPRDLTQAEAVRLCNFITSLVVGPVPQETTQTPNVREL